MKNYKKYLKKLNNYAETCGINVYHKELVNTMGEFIPSKRSINLQKDMTHEETLAVFLHELGHFLDQMINPDFTNSPRLNNAYLKINNTDKKLTKIQHHYILKSEEQAWEYGRSIGNKLKIPLGQWYDREMTEGLKYYKSLKTT